MTLKDWRGRADKTQADVALAVGVDPLTVSSWETGRKKPNATNMAKLFRLSGGAVTANDFYSVTNEAEQGLAA